MLASHENPRERQFAQPPNKGLIKLGLSRIRGGFRITLFVIINASFDFCKQTNTAVDYRPYLFLEVVLNSST